MENEEIERYVDAFERIMKRVGDAAVAVPILQELGKDHRMGEIRGWERQHANGSGDSSERPATAKQRAFLRSLGGEVGQDMSREEASRKIDELLGEK